MDEIAVWMDELIEKIEHHQAYGAALREAAQARQGLVLNYHAHGPGQPFCVSIQARQKGLPVLGQAPKTRELAHVRGIGQTQAEGVPLMTVLGERLMAHYGLEAAPEIQINGKPA